MITTTRWIARGLVLASLLPAIASAAGAQSLDELLRPHSIKPSATNPDTAINPFSATELNNSAVIAARDGDVYTAEALLRRAQKLAPENAIIQSNLQDLTRWLNRRIKGSSPPARTPAGMVPQPPPKLWATHQTISTAERRR